MIKLAWVLPTIVTILLIEGSFHWIFSVPVPFLAMLTSVTIAGAFGGQRSGLIAGIFAALFVVHAHVEQFGPTSLTGGVFQVLIGSALFLLTGILLGRLKDQRDAGIRSLRDIEQELRASLQIETQEKGSQSARVAESEAQLKTAIRIAGIGHFRFCPKSGDCTFCSEQHAAHFGLTSEEFRTHTTGPNPELFYIHADDHHVVENAIQQIKTGETQVFEYRGLRPDGEIRNIREIVEPISDEYGNVVEEVGTSIDLTELREAEMRASQSQRMEAIGTLTGGVAHDFNNLLAIILGNLELALESGQKDHREDLIRNAVRATNRGAGLIKNLISFSRRSHLEPKRINLNQLVQNTLDWGKRVMPTTIDTKTSLMDDLWEVSLDATSAENALINILLNARDAMPDGGKVTIETANMTVGEEYLSERGEDVEPGLYVMLAITDTGHGIPADKIEKVFEPFYTEKPVGQGSGLGLSMVQGFIKQSGGAIRVYSEVGVGTTFKLFFKACDVPATEPQVEVREHPQPSGEGFRILVAEDEEEVMYILKSVLEDAGYVVTTAGSGDEALEVFKASGPFDLLLTDIVMPGTHQGPALAKEIRMIDPDLPCIFLSGYASEATVHGNGLKPSDIRLMKPANRNDLLVAVSKALKRENSP